MENSAPTKTMLWWGRFDAGYSRNRVLRYLLREAGWRLQDFVPLISSFGMLEAFLKRIDKPDAVWVPAFRQRDFQSARNYANGHRIPLIFDPLISAWDKEVYERKKFRTTDYRACKLLNFEKKIFSGADLVIADTEPHRQFFIDELSAPAARTHVIPVGAEEGLFTQQAAHSPAIPPEIFFYGSFISLQGSETIVEAAIQVPEARWVFLGNGPHRKICKQKSQGHGHIRFEDPLPYENLPERIGKADILLGIFGSSPKAGRVIPNKVYQTLACGRPLVTRQSPAYPDALQNSLACGISFVPPENPGALAAAVQALLADPRQLPELGYRARNSYDMWFSETHIREALAVVLAKLPEHQVKQAL